MELWLASDLLHLVDSDGPSDDDQGHDPDAEHRSGDVKGLAAPHLGVLRFVKTGFELFNTQERGAWKKEHLSKYSLSSDPSPLSTKGGGFGNGEKPELLKFILFLELRNNLTENSYLLRDQQRSIPAEVRC